MQIGPVRFEFGGNGPNGVWRRKNDGTEENVTVPVTVVGVAALFAFCCCLRVVSWVF